MGYKGTVLTISELLDRARTATEPKPRVDVGLGAAAGWSAERCGWLGSGGEGWGEWWRFGILQTIDDYTSTWRRGGVELAARVFPAEPPRTGSPEIDAAFAALAEHLADRDGWNPPAWALDPTRKVDRWYATVPRVFHRDAERESPRAFRTRGIYITEHALGRA